MTQHTPHSLFDSLSDAQQLVIRQFMEGEQTIQRFPWPELDELAKQADSSLRLLGFGSLLNPDSARRTIPSTPEEGHPPALGFGLRRVFNYRMPDAVVERYGVAAPPRNRAALNCEPFKDVYAIINARILTIPLSDLPAFRERERGYDLVEVPMLRWPIDTEATVEKAYALCAPLPASGEVTEFVDDGLLPYPPYAQVCYDGALRVDTAFAQLFNQTTYLGDRETTLETWWERGS